MFINQKGVLHDSLLISVSRISNGFLFIGFNFYYYSNSNFERAIDRRRLLFQHRRRPYQMKRWCFNTNYSDKIENNKKLNNNRVIVEAKHLVEVFHSFFFLTIELNEKQSFTLDSFIQRNYIRTFSFPFRCTTSLVTRGS